MDAGESTLNLPSLEATESYFSDESVDAEDVKRMQINIQYGTSQE